MTYQAGDKIEWYQAFIGGELAYNAPTRIGTIVEVCEGPKLALGDLIVERDDTGNREGIAFHQVIQRK